MCKRVFIGHSKTVKQLVYSEKYKIFLSAGYEFKIFVWNNTRTKPIKKLKGHDAMISCVLCPFGTFNAVSCDVKGVIKIWDLRDYSCSQTLYMTGTSQVFGAVVIPKYRKLLAYCILLLFKIARKFHIYEYENPFLPEYSNDSIVGALAFSEYRLELFVGGCNHT